MAEQKQHDALHFRRSDSTVLALDDGLAAKFTGEQLWGSATLLVQLAFGRRWWIKGGFDRENPEIGKGKDWTRIISGSMHAVGDATYFLSDRSGGIPEGDTAWQRIRNTALHPADYPVRTRFLMAVPANMLTIAGDLYYGAKGGGTEKVRFKSAGFTALFTALQMWSMFKKPPAPENTSGQEQPEKEKEETPGKLQPFRKSSSEIVGGNAGFLKLLRFAVRNQFPYVAAYAIEQCIQVTRLIEGRNKIMPGPEQNVVEGSQMIKRASLTMVIATSNLFYNIRQIMRAETEALASHAKR